MLNSKTVRSHMIKSLATLALLVGAGAASANPITANLEDFTNGGGFFATVTMANNGANTVRVTATIAPPVNAGLTRGDILGIWFQITPESLLSGMTATSVSPAGIVTASQFGPANTVGDVGGANNNLGGAGNIYKDNWDIGIALGVNGDEAGFNQVVVFDLIKTGLTSAAFENQLVGMRVQSIEGGTFTAGSSKLVGDGEGPGDPDEPVPVPGTLLLLGLGLLGLARTRRTVR